MQKDVLTPDLGPTWGQDQGLLGPNLGFSGSKTRTTDSTGLLVGVVRIEIASLTSKSSKRNGVAPPSHSNWSLLADAVTVRAELALCA
jgi:hypothetical protein